MGVPCGRVRERAREVEKVRRRRVGRESARAALHTRPRWLPAHARPGAGATISVCLSSLVPWCVPGPTRARGAGERERGVPGGDRRSVSCFRKARTHFSLTHTLSFLLTCSRRPAPRFAMVVRGGAETDSQRTRERERERRREIDPCLRRGVMMSRGGDEARVAPLAEQQEANVCG